MFALLASPATSYVNAAHVLVDGGMSAARQPRHTGPKVAMATVGRFL